MTISISTGLFLGMLAPLAIENSKGAFQNALATLIPPNKGKSHAPIAPGSKINKDGSGAGEWCDLAQEAKDNLPCPIVRIDGLGLEALNGHYVKEPSKVLQGRAIYMHESDMFFAYWCEQYAEWRITIKEYVEIMQAGACRGWAAGTVGVNLHNTSRWFTTGDEDWEESHVSMVCVSGSQWNATATAAKANASAVMAEALAAESSFF